METDRAVQVARRHDDKDTQDFGATLVLILGAPSLVAAATAIGKWLLRNNQATLRFETDQGTLIANNLKSEDVAKVLTAAVGRQE
jgi:hypothetical protein